MTKLSTIAGGSEKEEPGLPIMELQTLNLALLQSQTPNEVQKLLEACRRDGFFYLDLRDMEQMNQNVVPVLEKMYQLTEDLYNLPTEEKMLYDIDKISEMKSNGYKPVGRNFGGLAGQRDGFETYAIIHLATWTIMESLSSSLGLPETENFNSFHRPTAPSPDIIRLLKYHPQQIEERGIPHAAHTDLGSLTFLFTRQPGLQVLSSDSGKWEWVQPKEGHAIVNLGDGMSLLTNGYLRSCLHRVGPLPNKAMPTRYSFAYLVRPEEHAPMTGLKSAFIPAPDQNEPVYNAGEWLKKKYGVLRLETRQEGQDWVLTGRQNELLH
ncbi:hypothetical protein BBP40_008396 [Aspergillus hancockii]|nr:hypothetical protein BBP40_008396 [Aspergillus hancockii]